MNRGIAHRSVFEDRRYIRMFLSLVARAVRAKRIEVHAFSIMTTHYHLLVRSLDGQISATMQRVQNEYVRWFNATHDRDGPLFRGRFQSRHITSDIYWCIVVGYIDDNACEAGMVSFPTQYQHSSAYQYARREGPRWLTRTLVERLVTDCTGRPFSPDDYSRFHASRSHAEVSAHMARMIEASADPQKGLDALLGSTPAYVMAWLRERARIADGGSSWAAPCLPVSLREVVSREGTPEAGDEWSRVELHAALLFEACGLSQDEVAGAVGESRWFVSRALRAHRRRLVESKTYAERCARIVHEALVTGHVAVSAGFASRSS